MDYSTDTLTTRQMGQAVDEMMSMVKNQRFPFERRWYDNNFFDDGYHFRYMSRTENKIVDLSRASTIWAPMRSIPKASRQIRGVANLAAAQKFVPIVYPERISPSQYPPVQTQDPETGQPTTQQNPEFLEAQKESKRIAQGSGHWIEEEFKKLEFSEKLALMIILTAKHGISYLQIWPDNIDESLKMMVLDAFDIYTIGSLNELEDAPFLIKTKPRRIADIKADERYPLEQVMQIHPDNRHASSDIKEAYERARHGDRAGMDQAATVLEKEAFIKEYLNDNNTPRIRLQKDGGEILKRKKKGDPIIRQTFVAGNITLSDKYLNLPGYPIVDLRFEPGPLYQVPLIERFIPQNKSLDLVVSRVERYLHTMVTGSWSVKSGEPTEPDNSAGGQIFKYNTVAPIQNPIASIPPFVFSFMNLLESLIEEQGVTTTALGKLPAGVKANAAIETLKESEFANLTILLERVKGVVKRAAEKMLDYADDYFVTPKTVYYMEKGEPQYFDIIGASAMEKRQDLKIDTEPLNAIPIKRDYRVDIEIERGLAYTHEGKKQAAKELGDYMVQLSQIGLVDPEVVKVYLRKLLEVYGFGASNEIMEAMEQYSAAGQMTEEQVQTMKVAIIEVMKDMQAAGILPTMEQRIEEGKVATAEAIRDTGLASKQPQEMIDPQEQAKKDQEMSHSDEKHQISMQGAKQKQTIEAMKAVQDIKLKDKMAKSQAKMMKGGNQSATSQRKQSKNSK